MSGPDVLGTLRRDAGLGDRVSGGAFTALTARERRLLQAQLRAHGFRTFAGVGVQIGDHWSLASNGEKGTIEHVSFLTDGRVDYFFHDRR